MGKDKDQGRGRTENGAVPPWEHQRHDRENTAAGKPPQPGQSTENAGMSEKGLGKTSG